MTFFSDHSHVNSQEVVCENPWRETLSEICLDQVFLVLQCMAKYYSCHVSGRLDICINVLCNV